MFDNKISERQVMLVKFLLTIFFWSDLNFVTISMNVMWRKICDFHYRSCNDCDIARCIDLAKNKLYS